MSKLHGNDGGDGAGQLKNAFFSLMTIMATSSQRDVRRPVQIMSTILELSIMTIGVNWWATHSGGPMHGEMSPRSVTQVWQVAEAVSAIVLAALSCSQRAEASRS